jgi:Family of unknown function (DUF6788)
MTRTAALRKRVQAYLVEQRELVRTLLKLRAQLQGSVFSRYGECGKQGCACQTGEKHGPYYVLSSRSAGKGTFVYLDGERVDEVKDLVKQSRAFRQGMARLRKLNQELVVALKSYQKATARTGVRRLSTFVSARSQ